MKVNLGITELNIVLKEIKNHIDDVYRECNKSAIFGKVKPLFYEILLTKTFIFYVKKGALRSSLNDVNFYEIADYIIYIDDIESLIILNNYDENARRNYKISWLAVEINDESLSQTKQLKIEDERDIFKALKHIQIANFLDIYKKEIVEENEKKMYRVDFQLLEYMVSKNVKIPIGNLVLNGIKNFYINIFKIQLSDDKNNSIEVIEQELKMLEYSEINITKKESKNVYNYRCQICNKLHKVILSKSQRDKHVATKKYLRVCSEFIKLNSKNRYEIQCFHSGTTYENQDLFFSFDASNLRINDTKSVNLDKVFLYQFYNYVHEDNVIFYNKDGNKKEINVTEFITKYGDQL